MPIVKAATIINAPPATVRATFLDWDNLTAWDKHYFKSFTPLLPSGETDTTKTGMTVEPGDSVHLVFWGGVSRLEILENSPGKLHWRGTWHGMLADRVFLWEAVEGDSSKTRIVQIEGSRGLLVGAIMTLDIWLGGSLKKKLLLLNENLKAHCERQA